MFNFQATKSQHSEHSIIIQYQRVPSLLFDHSQHWPRKKRMVLLAVKVLNPIRMTNEPKGYFFYKKQDPNNCGLNPFPNDKF